uniref:Programmed cell death protein 2 C-terminal domain-containing protein n=2 Tax=Physcomitrium patens TaxID=3218 RepID=A0A2K1J8U4_PHYPA|nr:programmed cell death protein 2-like [Physcomitrium patens]PNR37948.1 hypothetical protein PHYPA_021058 [Physcomitrium patens]|eukprot:XP_024398133.1 programmed cell death protein 2-like [Physcomitrella patens]
MGKPLPSDLVDPDDKEVLLGLPGAWAEETNEPADHYTTKIGGQPDWPVPLQDVNDELLKCGVCDGYLGLVAQIYAPLTLYGSKLEERSLFILGCPSASCGVDRSSWRTIRFQKDVPSENSSQQDQTESAAGSSTASSGPQSELSEVPLDNHGWGEDASLSIDWFGENSWDGYVGDDQSESMNMQELQTSLLEAGYAAAGSRNQHHYHHHHHHQRGHHRDTGSASGEAATSNRSSHSSLPLLPCFYIYTQSEESTPYESATSRSDNQADGEADDPLDDIEDPYGIVEGVGELWEGEEYEPERALSADRTYLKFKKKLDLSPEQCFRYCFGGRPLWATDAHDEPGTCGACGGPRVYEMQLMPPVLYFLQQAYKDLPPSTYGPDDWEWSTLVVYSCAQSCLQRAPERAMIAGERTDWSIIVEGTIVQAEVTS